MFLKWQTYDSLSHPKWSWSRCVEGDAVGILLWNLYIMVLMSTDLSTHWHTRKKIPTFVHIHTRVSTNFLTPCWITFLMNKRKFWMKEYYHGDSEGNTCIINIEKWNWKLGSIQFNSMWQLKSTGFRNGYRNFRVGKTEIYFFSAVRMF